MSQVTTKANIGDTVYVLPGSPAIAAVTIKDILVDEGTGVVTNVLSAPMPDGTTAYPDTDIYTDPTSCAMSLVTAFNAANPNAQAAATTAPTASTGATSEAAPAPAAIDATAPPAPGSN